MFAKAGRGLRAVKGEPGQVHLAGPKELSAECGGKGLGSIIVEIIYPGDIFSGPHVLSTENQHRVF